MEEWRTFLYPLGFIAAIPFTARFLVQWLISESKQKSVVPRSFWTLSLLGNLLLAFHACMQIQYNVLIIQIFNGVISWRNINLMQPSEKHLRFRSVLAFLFLSFGGSTLLFFAQFLLFNEPILLFRSPLFLGTGSFLSYQWHFLGTLGILLFTSRFWVQWWQAERSKKSILSNQFWILSLFGAGISSFYFLTIGDPVNAIGPAVGIIPYLRNLFLNRKTHVFSS